MIEPGGQLFELVARSDLRSDIQGTFPDAIHDAAKLAHRREDQAEENEPEHDHCQNAGGQSGEHDDGAAAIKLPLAEVGASRHKEEPANGIGHRWGRDSGAEVRDVRIA